MNIKDIIDEKLSEVILNLYQLKDIKLEVQENKTEFEGDFTVVTFPLVKQLKKNPENIGVELGEALTTQTDLFESFNVVKGFLNVKVKNQLFIDNFRSVSNGFSTVDKKNATVMVEYSSPNTNKPLHLGHIRNNLLGFSVAQILKEAGYDVIKTQIINDRGIHICKSMLAWEKFGNGETPETTNTKGDKFVGNYYVEFDKNYKKEIADLVAQGVGEDQAKKEAPMIREAQQMLVDWENGDENVRALWKEMNSWVYKGFNETYKRLGVDFDQVQYESNTYILGKDLIQAGLDKGVLFQKEDGSVWCDLTDEGLDQKLLLRSDGTSVYMTQDLGTAVERFKQNNIQKLIYTVGNEQDYHFQVLFKILKKLGYEWADQLYHLSYGMVELPEGKMKSREGTVVDADDLMQEMYATAKSKAQELGKLETLSEEDKEASYETVGLGALKYFMLKVDPKKKMLFNPAESIDFNGNTGPFIQYTYARIQSLLAKADYVQKETEDIVLNQFEKELIMQLANFKTIVARSAETLSPALVANYVYDLVKSYNSFYQNNPILNQDDENIKQFRLDLSDLTAKTIKKSLELLGIGTVNRM
ncbi:arginine--tRNA ligase [Chryseobacterium indologenes]|uniref:arginine--tRNA ligase n=1 Tax=Chryseobacterium indologenes TaxID=253 RepID=UPI000B51C063|nr:arginine--tRNA ligase [Chryseobacterium indologenes]ASE62732.1 arginine--tRNA ligase [Chryseobacterium indologenes]AYZ34369.1 arginine--tRNA ligase [Chryseobacterium indologenes]MBF6642913.1 arginine--tRNA ligase [Chryseobacterium indologenes]MBU3048103.1 arginine--tRNA ligase [Chryseobacterium indologenes]MEB4763252.1 arginine--tRNA ligase [Chryseobacterium indologenes]